jgi:two-component system, chemotaxis family, response regulator Rcp1
MHLLLVEDNPADAFLVRTGLDLAQSTNELHVVSDGTEALRFLRREGHFSGAPRPKLVIIDLNMPKMDGRELLHTIRVDSMLSSMPVLILTTTDSAADIDLCYRLGANSFVTKPTDIQEFFDLIRSIDTFWMRFASAPIPD